MPLSRNPQIQAHVASGLAAGESCAESDCEIKRFAAVATAKASKLGLRRYISSAFDNFRLINSCGAWLPLLNSPEEALPTHAVSAYGASYA